MPSGRPLHFFISRAGEDSADAKEIAAILEGAGHEVTLQDYDFKSGSFPQHIQDALNSADRFIAVLSPHYPVKPFTVAELHAAYARDPMHLIIPVRVTLCDPPGLIRHLIYVDFVGKNEAERKRSLLYTIGTPEHFEIRTSIQKLPTVDPHVFGRDAQLDWLEQAWQNPRTNFVQIIAPGGTGKTALMSKWYRPHVTDVTIFGWSFYSQGTREKSQTSSDAFFAEVLPWFGISLPATASIFTKVDALVAQLHRERVLLILDGIEPLQDPSGTLRDTALKALLQDLATRNAGMVLATTRVRLTDVADEAPHSLSLDLENLDPTDGADYLAHLGVRGPEDELRVASKAYENHAFSLTLLGTYLVTFCEGDIRRRTDIREVQVDETKPGRHARKVMASYARMYEGEPELDILRALGYFDRPAEPEALKLVMRAIAERKYIAALSRLREARLILKANPGEPLDCHPLVREHFAASTTREGHALLYEHYKKQAPHRPDTIEEMTPLFYAVYHGCQAGQHQAALDDVYYARICRGGEAHLNHRLGAFGTDLSLLANFFETPWTRPVAALSSAGQSFVINNAGFTLGALGRIIDAIEPVRAASDDCLKSKSWKNAAQGCSNLSRLHVVLGDLASAVTAARQSVASADRTGDKFQEAVNRATLADALHQSGDLVAAMSFFAEAERLQVKDQPTYPILCSAWGYYYCDLLLNRGQTAEVLRRAYQSIRSAERYGDLLSIGLDHLSLGRAHSSGSAEATHHLDQAVDFIRRSGQLDELPRALLARGTPRDLDEVFRIATRCGMRLYLADYYLAVGNLDEAERLINETGYHRRDAELAALRAKLSG